MFSAKCLAHAGMIISKLDVSKDITCRLFNAIHEAKSENDCAHGNKCYRSLEELEEELARPAEEFIQFMSSGLPSQGGPSSKTRKRTRKGKGYWLFPNSLVSHSEKAHSRQCQHPHQLHQPGLSFPQNSLLGSAMQSRRAQYERKRIDNGIFGLFAIRVDPPSS